ncbi:glycoside hydrolase family 27 protein [Edaphobacter acidisoli]|nr:glycoside hydrolase family 27 protein [Edaphobacter acidisoli]
MFLGLAAAAFLLAALPAMGQVASRPPMGWNSWNHFGRNVNDADVRAAADALVSSGMRDAGYIYVNIDDTWEGTRDAEGNIQSNEKFPDMKALADYVHSKGLKLGIYSSPGPKTCAGFEGSYGHEEQDARTYAAWGIDYLKYDLCSYRLILAQQADNLSAAQKDVLKQAVADPRQQRMVMMRMSDAYSPKQIETMKAAYEKMHQALAKTGRPIVFSLCQYGLGDVWKWGASVGGNAWRTTGDIRDNYGSMSAIGFGQLDIAQYAGPGHWNDPDMLEVGNGGMTADEYRTHMSLWALLAAPLLAGNDLSKMTPETLSILTNHDIIAVDQDALGKQADRVWASGAKEIWSRPLTGGAVAVGLFNRGDEATSVTLNFSNAGVRGPAKVRDLWAGKDLGRMRDTYTATVPRHGVVMLRLEP